MTLISTDRIIRRADVLSAVTADGQVVLDLTSEHYVGLDAVGSAIWERIESAVTVSALCDALGQVFDGDGNVVEADTLRFLDRLLDIGLITRA